MKILRAERLIDAGSFSGTGEWQTIDSQIRAAIQVVCWPPGADSFKFHPQRGKKRGEGNGVVPIKLAWQQYLKANGWALEQRLKIDDSPNPGPVDAAYTLGPNRFFCGRVGDRQYFVQPSGDQ